HWVTMVGHSSNGTAYDPNYFVIHDPAPRTGAGFANNYVHVEPLASGTLKGSSTSLAGQYQLSGWPISSVGTLCILDGVFVVEMVPTNQPPVVVHDSYSLFEDTPLTVSPLQGVLANDSDPEGVALEAILLSNPSHGSLDWNAAGWFTYTPSQDYYGPDSFTYRAFDGALYSNPATVNLSIASVNDPPIAVDDFYAMNMGDVLTRYGYEGVLMNDADPDNTDHNPAVRDTLTAQVLSNPAHGTLSFGSTGWFTYRPAADFQGTDSFTYRVFDKTDWSNVATAWIEVLGRIAGDANRDGVVNEADMGILAANWGKTSMSWAMGDFDGDGKVGPADAAILAANWGQTRAGESAVAATVPEPATAAQILLLVLLAATGRSRRDPAR
ncbi:MAG: tandem-95 repeat protein, partial [Pirellulaceae bacterium]|nr:tandem-95 repeat protein [Pirellulaceae bacterium]